MQGLLPCRYFSKILNGLKIDALCLQAWELCIKHGLVCLLMISGPADCLYRFMIYVDLWAWTACAVWQCFNSFSVLVTKQDAQFIYGLHGSATLNLLLGYHGASFDGCIHVFSLNSLQSPWHSWGNLVLYAFLTKYNWCFGHLLV